MDSSSDLYEAEFTVKIERNETKFCPKYSDQDIRIRLSTEDPSDLSEGVNAREDALILELDS